MKNIKIATINLSIKDFFIKWLEINKTFHKLKPQEQMVLSLLLYHMHLLKEHITKESLMWKILFDYDTRVLIREDEVWGDKKLSVQSFENILSNLRKLKVIQDNKISEKYIPNITIDSKKFTVIYEFKIL